MKADIEPLTAAAARAHLTELAALLEDAVDSGTSIGLRSPLAPSEATDYYKLLDPG
jgi:hypothetical protein